VQALKSNPSNCPKFKNKKLTPVTLATQGAARANSLRNPILKKVYHKKGLKSHMFSLMWIIDLQKMQQCYGTRVTLRGGCAREG
jgi:hypothetical protein